MEEKVTKRSTNFSAKEENILLTLVRKYASKIECKKTDTNTNKIKTEAWIKLEQEFNALCGEPHRTVKILKNKYENIKKRSKQKYADRKVYVRGTGGGPAPNIAITSTDNQIFKIIGSQFTGLESEFDDDAVTETIHVTYEDGNSNIKDGRTILKDVPVPLVESSQPGTSSDEDIVPETSKNVEEMENSEQEEQHRTTWLSNEAASLLKTPKSTPLTSQGTRQHKSQLDKKLENWANSKVQYSEIQKQCFIEEHNLKIHLMKEKNKLEMEIMKKEHLERMEILKLQKEKLLNMQ